ncbi:MAG: hotdog fold thioesterase [Bacteroidia bacterium]|nr:hotdog fold thioesterase [Bacteroidia bacterium]
MPTPNQIVNTMMAKDYFSQWLGIEVLEVKKGYSKLQMTVREDMLNGFGIAHGGITYSIADSALAFASNSHGQKAVSVETSISHTISLKAGDVIIAEAIEEHCSNKIGIYTVKIYTISETVALFKGTVYRTSKEW